MLVLLTIVFLLTIFMEKNFSQKAHNIKTINEKDPAYRFSMMLPDADLLIMMCRSVYLAIYKFYI